MTVPLDKLWGLLPAIAIMPSSNGGPAQLNVLAFLADGFGQLVWDESFDRWEVWRNHQVTPTTRHMTYDDFVVKGLTDSLVALGWYDSTRLPTGFLIGPRMNAFVGYFDDSGRSQAGTPSWVPIQPPSGEWTYTWDNQTPPSNTPHEGFFPTGALFDGARSRLRIFGGSLAGNDPISSAENRARTLRELFYDGQQWGFTEHGTPASWVTNLGIGRNNAFWDADRRAGYVFVVAAQLPGPRLPELYMRYWDPNAGPMWNSLGNPLPASPHSADIGAFMSTPVVVTRRGDLIKDPNNQFKMNAMVMVDRINQSIGGNTHLWELWERHYDGTQWQAWNNHGPLPGTVPQPQKEGEFTVPDFALTTGVVWHDDRGYLRVNLFGPTEDALRLIEFRWDGFRWSYGFNDPGPGNMRFSTVSSAQYGQRLTVVGRTEDGHLWEYYWTTQRGNWAWRQMYP